MSGEADEAIHGKRCQCGQYRVHSFGLLWAETEGVKWRHSVTLCGWVLREPPAVNVPLEPCAQCKAEPWIFGCTPDHCNKVAAAAWINGHPKPSTCAVPCLVHQYNFELEHKHAALKVRLLDAQKRIAELEAQIERIRDAARPG